MLAKKLKQLEIKHTNSAFFYKRHKVIENHLNENLVSNNENFKKIITY